MESRKDQDLQRVLDFYVRQCDEMGSRYLRLQQAHERLHVEARRCRVVADLVRDTIRIVDSARDTGQIASHVLDVILRAALYERGTVLRHDPATRTFSILSARGMTEAPEFPPLDVPPEALVVNSGTRRTAIVEAIGRGIGVPYFVWVMNHPSRYALVVGNTSELGLFGAFEPGDEEIVGAALNVFCDAIRRKEIERALQEANILLERRVEERTRKLRNEISERRQAERALSASEARLRGGVESLGEGFALFDADDRLVLANAAYRRFNRLSDTIGSPGPRFEDLLRKSIEEGMFPEAVGCEEKFIHERMERHRDPNGSIIRDLADGRKIMFREWPTPEGGIALAFNDLTDLVRAQEQSRRLQTEVAHVSRLNTIGEMAAGFAHEVNQPLAAINSYARGCVRRAQAGLVSPAELLPVLIKISEQAERAGEINRRIRGFLQKQELDLTPIDVNAAIDSGVRLLAGLAHEHEAEIVLELDPALPRVSADALHIQQVVLNLVRNGIEALHDRTEGPRKIVIRTTKVNAAAVRVEITDTGRGINDEVRARLFEPFFTTKSGGMGMGLLVCQRIIEAHEGELSIVSDGRDGTCAAFTLPLADDEVAGPGADEPAYEAI